MTDSQTNENTAPRKHKKVWRIVIENAVALALLYILYHTGMLKEHFMPADTTSCRELLQSSDMKIRSMQFLDSTDCGRGKSILRYNVIDEENDKLGVYCLSSTFQTASVPKMIGDVSCKNFDYYMKHTDIEANPSLNLNAFVNILGGEDLFFKTEAEIAQERERKRIEEENERLEREKEEAEAKEIRDVQAAFKVAAPMYDEEGTFARLCNSRIGIIHFFDMNSYEPSFLLWNRETRKLFFIPLLFVETGECPSSGQMESIFENIRTKNVIEY